MNAEKNEERTKLLTEGPMLRALLTLAVPIIAANVLQSAYQAIDTFWVGRLGADAVAAVSVSFPLNFFLMSVGIGLAIAGSTLVSQFAGARNYAMVNRLAAQSALVITLIGVVLSAIGYVLAPGVLSLMGIADVVLEPAIAYLRVLFLSMTFLFGFFMFQSTMRGIGEVKTPMYVVLSTVLLNFVLDPLFIFGWGPIPASGVVGAAWATLGTQALSAFLGLGILFSGRYGISARPRDFLPDYALIRRIVSLGIPASLEMSTRALGMTVFTFLVASFGTVVVAVNGIGTNILSFAFIPTIGLSMATAALVGQNMGAGRIDRAEAISRLAAKVGFVSLGILGIAVFVWAPQIVAFFVPDNAQVVAEGAVFLRIYALTFGFMGAQQTLIGTFRGSGNIMASMMISVVTMWVFQFPTAYVLSKHTTLGAEGLWWSFAFMNVAGFILTLIWFNRGGWKKVRLTKEQQLAEDTIEEAIVEEGLRH